jgi:hypothetical protein
MTLKVEVYGLDSEANDEKRGEIVWDGKQMTASDDSLLLKNIMSQPLWMKGGKELYAKDDPEFFMRSLCVHYSGSYVRCSKARNFGQ